MPEIIFLRPTRVDREHRGVGDTATVSSADAALLIGSGNAIPVDRSAPKPMSRETDIARKTTKRGPR